MAIIGGYQIRWSARVLSSQMNAYIGIKDADAILSGETTLAAVITRLANAPANAVIEYRVRGSRKWNKV